MVDISRKSLVTAFALATLAFAPKFAQAQVDRDPSDLEPPSWMVQTPVDDDRPWKDDRDYNRQVRTAYLVATQQIMYLQNKYNIGTAQNRERLARDVDQLINGNPNQPFSAPDMNRVLGMITTRDVMETNTLPHARAQTRDEVMYSEYRQQMLLTQDRFIRKLERIEERWENKTKAKEAREERALERQEKIEQKKADAEAAEKAKLNPAPAAQDTSAVSDDSTGVKITVDVAGFEAQNAARKNAAVTPPAGSTYDATAHFTQQAAPAKVVDEEVETADAETAVQSRYDAGLQAQLQKPYEDYLLNVALTGKVVPDATLQVYEDNGVAQMDRSEGFRETLQQKYHQAVKSAVEKGKDIPEASREVAQLYGVDGHTADLQGIVRKAYEGVILKSIASGKAVPETSIALAKEFGVSEMTPQFKEQAKTAYAKTVNKATDARKSVSPGATATFQMTQR